MNTKPLTKRPETPLSNEEFLQVMFGQRTLAQITEERDEKFATKRWNKRNGQAQNVYAERFAKLSTHQLLAMRPHRPDVLYDVGFPRAYEQALFKELAKRPHIPKGKEAKEARRTKAQANHGQSKSRNR